MNGSMVLRDGSIYPSDEVLKDELGEVYAVLECLFSTITSEEYDLTYEWRYYKDGKSWLGKVQYKKKTVFWLSVWDGFFKISFYFTEKHREAIMALNISASIKETFSKEKPVGKLIPLFFEINTKEQLPDLFTVVYFKKNLK